MLENETGMVSGFIKTNKRCPFCGSTEDMFSKHDNSCFLKMYTEQRYDDNKHREPGKMKKAYNTRYDQESKNES